MTDLVLTRVICSPWSFPGPLADATLTPVLGVSLSSHGGMSEPLALRELRLVRRCVLERERAPGSRSRPPSARRAPAPAQPRPRCQSPLALTGSRRSGPGAGLMQSARYLGRRLHYQPGPRPARPEAASARPAGRPARLPRSPGRARAPRGGAQPRPAGAPQPAAARRGTRDRGAAGHVSAPRARPGRGVPETPAACAEPEWWRV